MHIMKTRQASILMLAFVLFTGLVLGGCNKSDDSPNTNTDPNNKISTAKFTITITGAQADKSIISIVAAGNNRVGESNIWKVNNVARPTATAVTLDQSNFTGSTQTYVLETTKPVYKISINVGASSIASGSPYTLSYKAEINGAVVKNDANITISSSSSYTQFYTYEL